MSVFDNLPPEYREAKINLNPSHKWIYPIGDVVMWNIVREAQNICPQFVVSIAVFPDGIQKYFWATHHGKGGVIRWPAEFLYKWGGITKNLVQADKWFHEVGTGQLSGTALAGRS